MPDQIEGIESLTPTETQYAREVVDAARRRSRIRRITRRGAASLLLFATLVWIGTLAWESRSGESLSALVASIGANRNASDDSVFDIDDDKTIKKAPPSTYLPASVDGWTVQGIQVVPGSNGGLIEGSYYPQDDERNLVTPLIVYAQAAAVGGQEAGFVDRALKTRYTAGREDHRLGGVMVSTGSSPDRWSYYIGWTKGGKAYGVDATFRYRLPAGHQDRLRGAAEEIAKAIMKHKPGQGGAE